MRDINIQVALTAELSLPPTSIVTYSKVYINLFFAQKYFTIIYSESYCKFCSKSAFNLQLLQSYFTVKCAIIVTGCISAGNEQTTQTRNSTAIGLTTFSERTHCVIGVALC
jgi:hypothetical protein